MRGSLLGSLTLCVGCSGAMPAPDGRLADADDDGWAVADGDCDDTDAAISPAAVEVPNDGVDQDCDGVDAESLSVAALEPGDLWITEFLSDPLAGLGGDGEWVELLNTTDEAIDLQGLVLHDGLRDEAFVSTSLVVEPGGYAVLGAVLDPAGNGGVEVDAVWLDFGLSNDTDAIVLEAQGVVIDEVLYDPTGPLRDGVSASRDLDGDGAWPTGWCLGEGVYGPGGYGTPGADNDPCPPPFTGRTAVDLVGGELVITEILQAPAQVEGDFGEWIEVHNRSGDDVDMKGLSLVDESGDGVDIEVSVVVPAGGYVVLAASADPERNGGIEDVAWAWNWDYGLRNSGQSVRLMYGTTLLDDVTYDNGATFPDPDGASMSLDPSAENVDDNDDGSQWCQGATPYGDGDLGTPGEANPPC